MGCLLNASLNWSLLLIPVPPGSLIVVLLRVLLGEGYMGRRKGRMVRGII